MPSNESIQESEIQKVEDDLMEAMLLPNLTFLEKIFSDKFVCVDSDGRKWGKEKALYDYKRPSFKLSTVYNIIAQQFNNTSNFYHDVKLSEYGIMPTIFNGIIVLNLNRADARPNTVDLSFDI